MRIIYIAILLIFSAQATAGGFYHGRDDVRATATAKNYFNQTINTGQGRGMSVSPNTTTIVNDDYDEAAASAYVAVASLIECPDTSGGIGTQTRSFGLSVSIAAKDRDCAKIRMMQNIANMYPESRRHQVLLDHMMCTLEAWRELEQVGFSCAQFLALSPDPATHEKTQEE